MKKALSILLAVLMLMSVAAVGGSAAEKDYKLIYTYADIQANRSLYDQRYGTYSNHIEWQWLPDYNGGRIIYLAKNEYEAFQVYFWEQGEGRTLDISVTDFVNANGDVLPASVYNEIYMNPEPYTDPTYDLTFAEALVPYAGEGVETEKDTNRMFYVEVKSADDQPAGDYVATVTLSDENGVLNTTKVTARVWNFALPEGHLGTYLAGLYNAASGYTTTANFLKLSGVRIAPGGKPVAEDRELAKQILAGWDDFLLEHGVTPYEIPALYAEDDGKAAQLFMADPRRSMFMVPVEGVNYYYYVAKNAINLYKDLVQGTPEFEDKAFFYPWDEPSWLGPEDTAAFDERIAAIKDLWGENYHAIVPFFDTDASYIDFRLQKLLDNSDIFCPNQGAAYASKKVRDQFSNEAWHKTLRYQGDTWQGNTYVWSYGKSVKGVFARIFMWQAAALNSDGMLHWNAGYLPDDKNGNPYDVFEKNTVPPKAGPATGNGDGIYVYPGASLGLDPATPVASLRLKFISNGMDDYDYLMLVKEFLGEEQFETFLNKVLVTYKAKGIENIWSSHDGAFNDWEAVPMNNVRRQMGEALNALANTDHAYGDWTTVVEYDDDHNGIDIRTCENCGAKESRKTGVNVCYHEEYVSVSAVPATCTSEGHTAEKKCALCGEITSPSLPIAEMSHRYKKVAKVEPTCSAAGSEEYKECTVCGAVTAHDAIPATPHSFDEGKVTKAPTCTASGTMTYTCTVCNATETKTIKATGHVNTYATKGVAPTCTEKGQTPGTVCRDCGKVVSGQDVIPATGHTDNNDDGVCDVCKADLTGSNPSQNCSCNCHKSGFMGFIWKIQKFFYKLFGINPVCKCGAAHY